ncbi:MAG: cytochrome P460 family protein [Bryobacterales bacterium]|nr:cytochrome P460 family protein [Bryobacterales bacterium]
MRSAALFVLMTVILAAALAAADRAEFTKQGELLLPPHYREWVFLSSGLGMTYGPNAPAPGTPLRFDNVFVNPPAYREFLKTGQWPEGTILLLEIRASQTKGSINQHGQFQTGAVALEAHVKDTRRFPKTKGWAFAGFEEKDGRFAATAKVIPPGNRCEECHSQKGAVDATFVQFYPELIPVAKKQGTWNEANSAAGRH